MPYPGPVFTAAGIAGHLRVTRFLTANGLRLELLTLPLSTKTVKPAMDADQAGVPARPGELGRQERRALLFSRYPQPVIERLPVH